jgi:BirA family transcriptional regulator, biotin operon repressor / biotin---[acetyl-CoA-carboxylase] ligase
MLTEHTVAEAATAAGLTARSHFLAVTGSTNTDLWRMAKEGAPEWTVVVAGRQTAGRGRLGRTWVTPSGTVLHVSLLLRPRLEPTSAPLLSLAAAVAAADACRTEGRIDVRCKWPNDLIVGERKLGGILTEANVQGDRVEFVVIGTGLNVSQTLDDFPADLRETATSVAREGGDPDAGRILSGYFRRLRDLYGNRGEGVGIRVLDPYRRLCATIGRSVRASTVDGSTIEGVARAVGETGELIVETRQGLRAVEFGEVAHLG